MNALGRAFAEAAAGFIGAPFSLHGRHRATGLDCVGLVVAALKEIGREVEVPTDYGLRNSSIDRFLPALGRAGFAPCDQCLASGDLLLVQTGPAQFHLLVAASPSGFIHAHAGLRRIVATPAPLAWPETGRWHLVQD
jgi:hypothetical protein